jgi:hypothetical protein
MMHHRKCWQCCNIALHKKNFAPEVCCKKCGSQDTRLLKMTDIIIDSESFAALLDDNRSYFLLSHDRARKTALKINAEIVLLEHDDDDLDIDQRRAQFKIVTDIDDQQSSCVIVSVRDNETYASAHLRKQKNFDKKKLIALAAQSYKYKCIYETLLCEIERLKNLAELLDQRISESLDDDESLRELLSDSDA